MSCLNYMYNLLKTGWNRFHMFFHVVVQFYYWFNFSFSLFLYLVMNDNEYKTILRKTKLKPRIKLDHSFHMQSYKGVGICLPLVIFECVHLIAAIIY